MAGNQLGKSLAGAAEVAIHATGRYPEWWQGRRWDRPVRIMCGSESSELTRDGIQRLLVGNPESEEDWGTGFIPLDAINGWNRRQGTPNALDSISIKHKNGGLSTILFKSYDQGRTKWQANTVDIVWFDEEPKEEIYSEGITRTTATKGMVLMTFTPLLGMSNVVRRFLNEKSPDRTVIRMTIYDVEHISKEDVQREIDKYPEHERDARASGIPILGSGRIFPYSDSQIVIAPIQLPDFWPRIGGLDFGWDHPTAAVELAWDRDTDTIYVTREHRVKANTPVQHGAILRQWGEGLPWAWPHDGLAHDKGSGEQLAKQYKKAGLKMLGERATFVDGSSGVEAGLFDMTERMRTGRWKVFSTCPLWMEEFRLYHRDDGKVVKEYDDLISASRYATMMLRYAKVPADIRGVRVAKQAFAAGVGEVEW
jgi:phage terminase large subunit-like protein